MPDLLAARSLMAMSPGFHIIFAVVGIGLPLMMMVLAEWRWLRTGEAVYLTLTKRWAKGTAVLFVVSWSSSPANSLLLVRTFLPVRILLELFRLIVGFRQRRSCEWTCT